jgi:hypothetical protein
MTPEPRAREPLAVAAEPRGGEAEWYEVIDMGPLWTRDPTEEMTPDTLYRCPAYAAALSKLTCNLSLRLDQTLPKPYLVSRGGVRYQIGCQMGIEGIHGHLIAGIGTKANEPVGPHEDDPTIGNVRHLVELRRIDDRHKSFPALAKIVQTRRIVRHDKMVGRTAKVVACSETDSSS